MTQEDKKLLLTDLCARLPYGLIVLEDIYKTFDGGCVSKLITITEINGEKMFLTKGSLTLVSLDEIKPYLRPMSSMTDAEKKDFPFPYYFEWIDSNFSLLCSNDEVCASIGFDEMYEIVDWLNSHHFDYRNLIDKGLALEAPADMYKID